MPTHRAVIRLATVAVAALVAGGCTAGIVVDENFNPVSNLAGVMTWIAVDSDRGQPTGDQYEYWTTTGAKSYAISFDPYAAETDTFDSKGNRPTPVNGVANSAQFIPPGSYYIVLDTGLIAPVFLGYISKVFKHQYTESCSDYFNGNTDRCAQYYFLLGAADAVPPDCMAPAASARRSRPRAGFR